MHPKQSLEWVLQSPFEVVKKWWDCAPISVICCCFVWKPMW